MFGDDLLFGISESEKEKMLSEGQAHKNLVEDVSFGPRIEMNVNKDENYKDNPEVIELLSKGYVLKKNFVLAGLRHLVFDKE